MPTTSSQPGISRRHVLQLSGLTALGVVAGCGSNPTEAAGPSGAGGKQSTLTFAQGAGWTNLDPTGPSISDLGFFHQMFDPLVWRDDKGELVPHLAESWAVVDDVTWEFKLRKDVKFHNDEPFTADSVTFTMGRIMDPANKATVGARFNDVDKVEKVDDYTVRFITKKPLPTLLIALVQACMVPPKYFAAEPEKSKTFPIGTGPFKFVEYRADDRAVMAANKTYFKGAPKSDNLVMRIIPDPSARLAALMAGEIDMMDGLPLDAIASVEGNSGFRTMNAFLASSLIIQFDTLKDGPFADPKVRTAVNMGINLQEINEKLLLGKMRPLQGQLIPPGQLGFNPDVPAYPYDPDKAKQMLADAGYPNGFKTTLNGRVGFYQSDREIMLTIVDQLSKIGVDVTFHQVEGGQWPKLQLASQQGPMFLVSWFSFGDPAFMTVWLTEHSTLGVYVKDAEYTKLTDDAQREMDPKKREELYQQAMKRAHDEALAMFLFQLPIYYGMKKSVSGFTPRDDKIIDLYTVSVG